MAATGVRDKYHIAVNSKGYMLRGAPDRPAYQKSIVPSQIDRLAISDLAYSDFSGQGLFYLAQTDWSAGVKSEKTWRDDAKYWYSTNIDTYSEQGCIQLEKQVVLEDGLSEVAICGTVAEVDDAISEYIGCEDDGSGNVKIYKESAGSWSDIAGTDFHTNQNSCTQLFGHKNLLYATTIGIGDLDVVASYDGTSWTDHSAAIITASTLTSIKGARGFCELSGTLYVLVNDYLNEESAIMSTVDNGTTWVEELHIASTKTPNSAAVYNSKIYYILSTTNLAELRAFDPSDSSDILIKKFLGSSMTNTGVGDKYLSEYGGKLIITIPDKKIYEYDGSAITEIWSRDDDKYSITGNVAEGIIHYGATEYDDKLHWGNLIYDGTAFYNWKQPLGDDSDYYLFLLYVNQSGSKRLLNTSDKSYVFEDATTYKTTLAKNYLVFNEMAPVASLDKLLNSVTIIFDKMATGQSIKLEYSIDGRSTWVAAGTRSYSASDSDTKKEFIIPGSVIFNKIWWRISLDGSATTPKIRDVIMSYKPMPDFKNRWSLGLNFSDSVKLLNTQQDQREGDEMNSELWNEKFTKQKVVFEDIDYAECTIVSGITSASTSALISSSGRFPRQGRVRAVSGSVAEEMYYTSATTNKILGLNRGQRGTTPRAYSAAQQLDNGYDVYVEDIRTNINFTDENKTESIAQVLLLEA